MFSYLDFNYAEIILVLMTLYLYAKILNQNPPNAIFLQILYESYSYAIS